MNHFAETRFQCTMKSTITQIAVILFVMLKVSVLINNVSQFHLFFKNNIIATEIGYDGSLSDSCHGVWLSDKSEQKKRGRNSIRSLLPPIWLVKGQKYH